MREDYFQEKILRENAELLADRLCKALLQLTSDHSHDPQQNAVSIACETDFFTQGCLRALEIKAQTHLSRCKYALVFFYPGAPFSPDTMRRDDDVDDAPSTGLPLQEDEINDVLGNPIKLCLFPALFAVPLEESDLENSMMGTDIAHWVVDYGNFIRKTGVGFREHMLIAKAVVLV